MQKFRQFFQAATGHVPYGYQARVADNGLPDVLCAPAGTGKTGIIVAWLWRRLHADPDGTPRRLVYALPQRSLVEHVAGEVSGWLANLGLAEAVAVHLVMDRTRPGDFRQDMHRPAIVIGTVDSLVSKALNRGYGLARAIFPIDFALVTNGAQWVIDETSLCPQSATTLRRLVAFAKERGTAEPFGLTCMSAIGDAAQILPAERAGELAVRLNARRTIRRLDTRPGDYQAISEAALRRHRAGELTVVVLNTVAAAQQVFRQLSTSADCVLLHSQFRGVDGPLTPSSGVNGPSTPRRIVVATQAIEAGTDLDASVLITEAAPWPSLVRRAARCNRAGLMSGAEVCWVPPPDSDDDINAAVTELTRCEGETLTGEELADRDVAVTRQQVAELRYSDLVSLFDTGNDIDVAPYVRDAQELCAQVAWVTWTPQDASSRPPDEARLPAEQYRCQVPLSQVDALGMPVWRLHADAWVQVTAQAPAKPGELLIVNAADGGYDPVTGFDPSVRQPVPGCPSLDPRQEAADATTREWISLDQHSHDTRRHAAALLDEMRPALPAGASRSAVTAALLHDAGKAHEIWQDALCALAPDDRKAEVASGRPWAKSAGTGRLLFAGGVSFRHELASLLILDGPMRDLLRDAPDADLARYLVLAHHGKLRVHVADADLPSAAPAAQAPPGPAPAAQAPPSPAPAAQASPGPAPAAERTILGLTDGAVTNIPPMFGEPASTLTVDLGQFYPGGERSWTRTTLGLLDRYGPFVLGYLETVVRIADWRASAEEAAGDQPAFSRDTRNRDAW